MTATLITTIQAKEEFSDILHRVLHNHERIILTRRDKQIAAIVPIEDLALLEKSQSKSDVEEAAEALKDARKNGTITLDDLKEELG